MPEGRTGILVTLAIAGFAALSVAYNLASPPFENPDEINHAEYVTFIADQGRLPTLLTDCVRLAFHPPLYHALLAPIARIAGITTEGVLADHRMNPEFPSSPVVLAHGEVEEEFPYGGRARFVHVARLLTTIMGTLVVLYTYKLGRVLDMDVLGATLATATVASVPQFQYIAASVNHDALASAFAAALIYYSVLLQRRPSLAVSIAAGIALGAGLLVKSSCLVLVPLPFVFAAISARPMRDKAAFVVVAYVVAFVIAGWWYLGVARQWGTIAPIVRIHESTWVGYNLVRAAPFEVRELPALARQLFQSFWFLAGLLNVAAPPSLYAIWAVVSVIAGIGLIAMLRSRVECVLAIAVGVCVASVLMYNRHVYSAQGRYFFIILPIVGLAVARGVGVLVPLRARAYAAVGLTALVAVASVACWHWSFAPAYRRPMRAARPEHSATSQLYCANAYTQTVASRGGVLTALRLHGRKLGEGSFTVSLNLSLPDGTTRDAMLPGASMTKVDESIAIAVPPLALAPNQRYLLTLRAPDAHPFARPAFDYARSDEGALSVNGIRIRGNLELEEVME